MSFYENLSLVHRVANPGVFLPLWCYLALLGIFFCLVATWCFYKPKILVVFLKF